MNWAPPVLSSSRLYQPLWSGPGVDDITGFYCIEKKNTLHPSQSNRTVFLLCFECYPSTFTRFPSRPFDLSSPFLSVEFDDEEFPCQKVTGPPRQGRWWEEEGVGGGAVAGALESANSSPFPFAGLRELWFALRKGQPHARTGSLRSFLDAFLLLVARFFPLLRRSRKRGMKWIVNEWLDKRTWCIFRLSLVLYVKACIQIRTPPN